MLTLALDISTTTTGYSLWNDKECIINGSAHKKAKKGDIWIDRVKFMAQEIKEVVKDYRIDYIVVEDAFSRLNVNTLKKLCLAQGLIIGALLEETCSLVMVYPKTWQKFYGITNLKREQLKEFTVENASNIVTTGLNSNTDDEADAIHIGNWFVNQDISKIVEKEK